MHHRLVALACAGALALSSMAALADNPPVAPDTRDAVALTREIDAGVNDIAAALRRARQARDVVRASALSDRLSQAHAAARRAREVRAALAEATEAATRAVRLSELRTLRARMRRLVDESAEADVVSTVVEATRVTLVVDGALPSGEPARPGA